MGKPQTIIGAERFHFRVRDGIGWFPLAMAARQAGGEKGDALIFLLAAFRTKPKTRRKISASPSSLIRECCKNVSIGEDVSQSTLNLHSNEAAWVLYGQASRSISTG